MLLVGWAGCVELDPAFQGMATHGAGAHDGTATVDDGTAGTGDDHEDSSKLPESTTEDLTSGDEDEESGEDNGDTGDDDDDADVGDDDADDDDADDDDADDDDVDDDDADDDDADDDDADGETDHDDTVTGEYDSESGTESGTSTGVFPEPVEAALAFVTSTVYDAGELNGVAGADARCQAAAEQAGLAGGFRAWLSSSSVDARDRFAEDSAWVRADGRPVVVGASGLPGSVRYALDLDEYGRQIVDRAIAWTGTTAEGRFNPTWGDEPCGGWTSDEGPGGPVGLVGGGSHVWTDPGLGYSCWGKAHLYCLGLEALVDVHWEPEIGRRVFVSSTTQLASAGRAAADAMCQQDALAAGFTGSFLALMAAVGEAATDRFDLSGPRWLRLDGVPIFSPGEPMAQELVAPVSYVADGSTVGHFHQQAWLGAASPHDAGTADSSCQGWTQAVGDTPRAMVDHVDWLEWDPFGEPADSGCEHAARVLCFEQ
ncbi:MAG: hypothetical protein B7733_24130 [Myxococcales bacterium FL481]|nr:MAG: hypothetical protein B7733_24130 [Myxococcales bacterium FL481]